jgi:hypothetical protein
MADMLPQEIAEKIRPRDFITLCSYIERTYKQKFGVLSVIRGQGHIIVMVELEDKTHHRVKI